MYRIHFDHKCGKFCIQVRVFGMFWKTVTNIKKRVRKPVYFITLEQATLEIKDLGLDQLYRNCSESEYRKFLNTVERGEVQPHAPDKEDS